jgi:hypothetical protein
MESSPGCWAAFGEVLAREYSDSALLEVHRLTVDAYALQHPGKRSPQSIQSVGLHLVRLHLQLREGLSPERANAVMTELVRRKDALFWLEPPASVGSLTVAYVHPRSDPTEHKTAVRLWAQSALSAWSHYNQTIANWAALVGSLR